MRKSVLIYVKWFGGFFAEVETWMSQNKTDATKDFLLQANNSYMGGVNSDIFGENISIGNKCVRTTDSVASKSTEPIPATWPHQFHAMLFMNRSGTLQVVNLWYDWPNGRNFNIIQDQLGKLLYDLEWDNGTSFIYTLDSAKECRVIHFPVGILRPNWLEGATYLGQRRIDGFLCNVWEKVDFIRYYEDVDTKRPVHWVFSSGYSAYVMTFEVGAVLEDSNWQAPAYCFNEAEEEKSPLLQSLLSANSHRSLMIERGF